MKLKNVVKRLSRILQIAKSSMSRFGYDAVKSSPTRRPIAYSSRSEDRELTLTGRRLLVSESREYQRNFALAGFALRKHLQFVSYYRFSAETPYRDFNRALEKRVELWKNRKNCDAARRSNFDELITLIESHRTVDGDVGILKRSDCRLQIIEGDRIKNPKDVGEQDEHWTGGVKLNDDGAAICYQIWRRTVSGELVPERVVNANNFDLPAYRMRRDQIRGVSLFAPALKTISYLYDGLDYALAKLKLEQMTGLVTRLDDGGNLAGIEKTDSDDLDQKLRESFGSDLLHIALKTGEDAEFMESNNPSQNFQTFCELVMRLVFSALDLPYSFFDGSKTNFYGSKGEFEQYLDTVEKKQAPVIGMLDEWIFDWLLPNWLADPNDPIQAYWRPEWRIDDLRGDVGWRGSGLPSWRLFEYVKETQTAISSGLVDPFALADSFGESLTKNIERIAIAKKLAEQNGVWLPYGEESRVNVGL